MPREPIKPTSEEELRRFGEALMQVSKEELKDLLADDERDRANSPKGRRGRPPADKS